MTFWNFSSSAMDLDFTTDKLNFLEPEPFISSVLYDPSNHQIYRKEIENLSENPPLGYPVIQEHVADNTASFVQSQSSPLGVCEADPMWSIDASSVLKDKLMVAIEYLKEYVEDSDVLIQIWMPTERGGQIVLTTIDQPYSLNPNCKSLASYRNVSKSFHLTTEEDSKESAGLPGRVFLGRFPEWTPDVRFFRSEECPRKYYAKMYNVSGCLALPVLDQDNGTCLAVVEIVTTAQKISYHFELEIVNKALEAVDLRSTYDLIPLAVKACNDFFQIAVPEISEILKSICQTYRLPLAETWALHDGQFESEQQQFHEKYDYCISTVDSACYIVDNDLLGFHESCSEQYLFLEQGIVGKAFATNKQCFATDITSFSKTNYPLSHHARMFNLGAAIAIPLRNLYTGSLRLVLEIFLPRECRDTEKQKEMWNLLPIVIQQNCRSFFVIMDKEIDDVVKKQPTIVSVRRPEDEGIRNFVTSAENTYQNKCGFVSWECLKEEPEGEFKVITQWDNIDLDLYDEQVYSDFEQLQQNSMTKLAEKSGRHHSLSSRRAADKKQNKIERTISLQILRQYFGGSLKDAAKSIGVCPTTLKRMCRQHGIDRWPARKIKKVNHTLRKLQLVVNSIHGAEGPIDSFYKTFPELNSPIPVKDPFSPFKKIDKSNKTNPKPDSASFNPKAINEKSLSSLCSQNSDSSIRCSTEAKKLNDNGFSLKIEDPLLVPERTCTEGELHSNKISGKNQSFQAEPPLPKSTTGFRMKASFGEEHVRFSFLPSWSFKDLQQEIAKRFKIDDFSRIDIKYMDIENESVLLTCDADLEECLDLLSFSDSNTIKISLHQACQLNRSSSFTQRGLS